MTRSMHHSSSSVSWPLALLLCIAGQAGAQEYAILPGEKLFLFGSTFQDLDGDTIPDVATSPFVVATSAELPGFTVRRGRGNGTFEAPVAFGGGRGVLLIGDVSGDGALDVVLLDADQQLASPTLWTFLGDGSGAFAAPVETTLPTVGSLNGSSPSLFDFDEDHRADVLIRLAPLYGGSKLVAARGMPDGHFALVQQLPLDNIYKTDVVEDLDLDGHLDVLGSAAAELYPLLGTGSDLGFILAAPSPIPDIDAITIDRRFLAEDFDLDGRPDLVITGRPSYSGAGLVLQEHGLPGLLWTLASSTSVAGSGPSVIADFDEDGWPDLFLSHGAVSPPAVALDQSSLLHGQAGGGWRDEILVPFVRNDDPVQAVDVNVDGALDVAADDDFLLGDGLGGLISRRDVFVGAAIKRLLCLDLDGDADPDFVGTLTKKAPSTLATALGHGDGDFDAPTLLDLGSDSLELAAADLDGDARADLVLGDEDPNVPGPLVTWMNDGSGSAFSRSVTLGSFVTTALGLADLDGDGAADVVVADDNDKALPVFVNSGDGSFSSSAPAAVGAFPRDLAIADVDGDGALDVVVASYPKQALYVLLGSGDAHFGAAQEVALGARPMKLAIADLNDDGLLDLVAAASPGGYATQLTRVLAIAPASFGAPVSVVEALDPFVTGLNFAGVVVEDLDRDGHLDLVSRDGTNSVLVLRGLGNAEFEGVRSYRTTLGNGDIQLGDIDGNGFIDIAVAADQAKAFEWLPNVTTFFPSLGYQHASSSGVPQLLIAGTPVAGEHVSSTATALPAASVGALFLGLGFAPQPFAGGTLVPSPNVVLPMLPDVPLAGRWPELAPGTAVFAQAWFASGGEISATNAVEGITQP